MHHRGVEARAQHLHEEPFRAVAVAGDAGADGGGAAAGQHLRRALRALRHAELPGQDVGGAERQDAERGGRAGDAAGDLGDGAVAPGRDHHGHAAPGGFARQQRRVAGPLGLGDVGGEAAARECGERTAQPLPPAAAGRGVEDDQHGAPRGWACGRPAASRAHTHPAGPAAARAPWAGLLRAGGRAVVIGAPVVLEKGGWQPSMTCVSRFDDERKKEPGRNGCAPSLSPPSGGSVHHASSKIHAEARSGGIQPAARATAVRFGAPGGRMGPSGPASSPAFGPRAGRGEAPRPAPFRIGMLAGRGGPPVLPPDRPGVHRRR